MDMEIDKTRREIIPGKIDNVFFPDVALFLANVSRFFPSTTDSRPSRIPSGKMQRAFWRIIGLEHDCVCKPRKSIF